jgi:hypothetical protein
MAADKEYDPYKQLDSQKRANKTYQSKTEYKAIKNYLGTPKGKEAGKRSKLKTKYGITLEEYKEKLLKQQHKCSICGIDEAEETSSLCVDHDHATGKVRDLLCSKCNVGLGMFKENIETLASAISYLNKHRENK